MKILLDARLYGLEHAGLGRYTMNLVDELVKQDKKNEYIIFLRKKYYKKLTFPKNWKKKLVDFRHYTITEQIKLPWLIYNEHVDLVHFPHLNVPILYHGKYVVTIHDLLMHKSKGKGTTTLSPYPYRLKRLAYRLTFRAGVMDATKIIVPSNTVKKELVNYFDLSQQKVVVINEGFNKEFSKKTRNKTNLLKKYNIRNKYFIYVGNAYPHKNLERAIHAITFINEKNKNEQVDLVIVGSRDVFRKRLLKSLNKTTAEKYVKLLGFVNDEDLSGLLSNSVAFVYPSLDEGFGLQGLESISAGTLVLASNIPVFKEVYNNNVLYFNPYDAQSIAISMKKVMKLSSKKRRLIIYRGQNYIKRYSWTKMAQETRQLYYSLKSK